MLGHLETEVNRSPAAASGVSGAQLADCKWLRPSRAGKSLYIN
jgi:hypothetical protein